MIRAFRKYHRILAIVLCLPLFLTVLTGIAYTIFADWLEQSEIAGLMMKLHTMRILGLNQIYPLLNGLGLIGLLVTGLSMTNLFKPRRKAK